MTDAERRLAMAVNLLRGAHAEVGFDNLPDKTLQEMILKITEALVEPFEALIREASGTAYRPPREIT